MHLENTITIEGDPDRIFQLAANIQDWPDILPHYRYVRIEEMTDLVKVAWMGAARQVFPQRWGLGGFPVKWRARQELIPEERRIRFKHIGGISRGMDVEWRIEPEVHGVHVSISHELTYDIPLVGPLFARYIVGGLFVHNIAGKTLRCIKKIVEAEARSCAASS